MSKIDQTTGRRDGVTCYEQDEQLCTDPMCKPDRCIIRESNRINEDVTAYTMRKIRNEIVEQCAKAVEGESLMSDRGPSGAYNQAICDAAMAVRALKDQ